MSNEIQAQTKKLDKLSHWLDSSIRLPGGYRIGWDGIIGLIPGVGDLTGLAVSLYIMVGARRAGASLPTLLRMLMNVGIEAVVGVVPVIGDIFDLAFKANTRNMTLLKRQLETPEKISGESKGVVIIVVVAAVVVLLLLFYAAIKLITGLFSLLF